MRILQSASLLLLSLCLCASCARTEGHMEVIDQETGGPGYAPKPKPAPKPQAPAAAQTPAPAAQHPAPAAQPAAKTGGQVHQPAAAKAQAGQSLQARPNPQAAREPAKAPAQTAGKPAAARPHAAPAPHAAKTPAQAAGKAQGTPQAKPGYFLFLLSACVENKRIISYSSLSTQTREYSRMSYLFLERPSPCALAFRAARYYYIK